MLSIVLGQRWRSAGKKILEFLQNPRAAVTQARSQSTVSHALQHRPILSGVRELLWGLDLGELQRSRKAF